MRPTGQRWRLRNQHEFNAFDEWVHSRWEDKEYPTVQVMKNDRSLAQNTMIYALYGDIARQSEDKSVLDVKCECKLHYGVAILKAADPNFADFYDKAIKNNMTYEDKLRLMVHYDITSLFTVEQASEYIDTIIREYTKQGYRLDRHEA